MSYKFFGKYILKGQIQCLTGLHIGGSTTGIEIGGNENPVIKDPLTEQPYIPGSSLKGKLRTISEWRLGLIKEHTKHSSFAAYDCSELKKYFTEAEDKARWRYAYTVGRLYGPANDDKDVRKTAGPTRLTVRDSFLTEDSVNRLETELGKRLFTEIKTENALDRVTAVANPRPIERVPRGVAFAFTFILDVYQQDDCELFQELFAAMHQLEQSSLGGSGSRGHGQIQFAELELSWHSADFYKGTDQAVQIDLPAKIVSDLNKKWDSIPWPRQEAG